MATRKVTIYSSVGQTNKEIDFSGTTFADLKVVLDAANVQYNGMTVVEGTSQVNYESDAAIMPEGDFQLFFLPKEVKSGIFATDEDDDGEEDEEDEDDDTSIAGRLTKVQETLEGVTSDLEEIIEEVTALEAKALTAGTGTKEPSEAEKLAALKAKALEIQKNLGRRG